MQFHRDWLMSDLRKLNEDKKIVSRLTSEIIDLEREYTVLKAKSYDNVPVSISDNYQRDRIENNLARREELQLFLKAKKSHIDDMERLLNQLPDDDRKIIECMVISHSKTAAQIGNEIGYEVRQIHNKKQNAIEKLLCLRFGQGYQP